MGIRDLFNRNSEVFRVKRLRSSRAVYHSEEIQRIEIELELETGDRLKVELLPRQAYQLVVQTKAAYDAIHPRIPHTEPNSPSW